MSHVLDRLNKARTKDTSVNADVTDRIYNQLMTDVRIKAQDDARNEARAEMETLRAETLRVEAERDAARVLKSSADNLAQELKSKIASLESDLRTKVQSLAVGKQEYLDDSQGLKVDLFKSEVRVRELEIEIASLTGKLSGKSKNVVVQNTQTPIPAFDVAPVRGADGKIVSARLTPVTH